MRRLVLLCLVLMPLRLLAYSPELLSLSQVPRLQLDAAQVQTAIEALDSVQRHYAVAQALSANGSSGSWSQDGDGLWHWRLRLASPGAESLAVQLASLTLPTGAELWLYDAQGRDLQGPYAGDEAGRLWPALIRGEELVLDARMPASARSDFAIQLQQVFHGFRSFVEAYPAKSSFGNAGACSIDAACSDGDRWRDEIRSTVLLTIGGTTLCSGNLINNTAQDNRALILTAHHCGISAANVASTRAYFNVQRPNCGSDVDGPVDQNIAGARVLASSASNSQSDYTLFELASLPPSSFQAYYAGWDISGNTPQSGVGISHPAGDDKKIATYTMPAQAVNGRCVGLQIGNAICSGFSVDTWAVSWARGDTEGGSSGSGLWSQDHRIVGTLSSGSSACSGTSNNGGTDYYARLDRAWTARSSTGASLAAVLDAGGSDCASLPGRNPGSGTVSCSGTGLSSNSGGSVGSSVGSGGGGACTPALLLPLALMALRRRRQRLGARD